MKLLSLSARQILTAFLAVSAWAQPSFTPGADLNNPRSQHPATLLPNGRVLIAGDVACNPGCFSGQTAEVYDAAGGAWTSTFSTLVPRYNHVAERLPDGKALIAAGYVSPGVLTASAEIFDPVRQSWTLTNSLITPRQFHKSAGGLAGGKVLVGGGLGVGAQGQFVVLDSAELYDPAAGVWKPTGAMRSPRVFHTLTALANGKVLAVGGINSATNSSVPALVSAEVYDPATNIWTATSPINSGHASHTATLLPNGKVLVAGGRTGTCELYDPVTNRWSITAPMSAARSSHTATLLPNGRVLVAGGNASTPVLRSAEIYDPATETWTPAANLAQPRVSHSATLLPSGKILIAGGSNEFDKLNTSELYGVATLQPGEIANLSAASFADNAAVAPNSFVAALGTNIAKTVTTAVSLPLPSALGGTSVTVKDSLGTPRPAAIYAVSPGQVNYIVPSDTAMGAATVTIAIDGATAATGEVLIVSVAPGLFSANSDGQGVPAGTLIRSKADGTQTVEAISRIDPATGRAFALPIDLGPATDQLALVLYGTGLRARTSLDGVRATLGAEPSTVLFAGPSPEFPGIDQLNLMVPPALAGRGEVEIALTVDGLAANTLTLKFR